MKSMGVDQASAYKFNPKDFDMTAEEAKRFDV